MANNIIFPVRGHLDTGLQYYLILQGIYLSIRPLLLSSAG
jgi:hypothetical protein